MLVTRPSALARLPEAAEVAGGEAHGWTRDPRRVSAGPVTRPVERVARHRRDREPFRPGREADGDEAEAVLVAVGSVRHPSTHTGDDLPRERHQRVAPDVDDRRRAERSLVSARQHPGRPLLTADGEPDDDLRLTRLVTGHRQNDADRTVFGLHVDLRYEDRQLVLARVHTTTPGSSRLTGAAPRRAARRAGNPNRLVSTQR